MNKSILYSLVFTLCSVNLNAQSITTTTDKIYVSDVIKKAALIRGKNTSEQSRAEAEEFLLSSLDHCNTLTQSKSCRSAINYTLGYYNHEDAMATKFSNEEYLNKAEDYYQSFLSDYPDNKKVLQNLQIVQKYLGRGERLEETTNRLIESDPDNKQQHERYYGDVLKNRGQFDDACTQYRNAYLTNPWEEASCRRIVNMFKQADLNCSSYDELEKFAYHCVEAGYPYLSNELLERKLKNELSAGDLEEANETFVHLINILADNGWLSKQRIENMRFSVKSPFGPLEDLRIVMQNDDPDTWIQSSFWTRSEEYYNSEETGRVMPMSVLAKIYFSRATDFRKIQKPKETIAALELSMEWIQRYIRNYDEFPSLFFPVSTDLAKAYYKYKRLDPNGRKLIDLENKLFAGKADAYSSGNNRLIREYHTTLGLIYYDQKRWQSNGFASNAKFQLSRALDSRFGPIINPKLREMLGEVYSELGDKSNAAQSYMDASTDYLRLDKIKRAIATIDMTKDKFASAQNAREKRKLHALSSLAKDRQDWSSATHAILIKSGDQFINEMNEIENKEKSYSKILDKDFVNRQIFKGLSDLAKNTPADRINYQQFLYAAALTKIERSDNLDNLADNNRISDITKSLELSIKSPNATLPKSQLASDSFQRVTTIKDWRRGSEDKIDKGIYKSYKVEGQEAILHVPATMFDFSRIIFQSYLENKIQTPIPQYEVMKISSSSSEVQYRKIEG